MIKYNNNTIYDWNFDASNLIKVYRNNAIVFYKFSGESPTPEWKVCFAVVDDISQYTDREFEDVYDNATEKWYKLNNLNEYEEYGVYGSGRTSCEGYSRLPQGYTEVEYVERNSAHNGYLPLGEYFTENTVIDIDFKMTQSKGNAIIGDYGSNDKDDWRVFLNYDVSVNNWLVYDFIDSRNYYNTGDWSKRFHLEIGNYYIKDLNTDTYLVNATRKTSFTRPNQMYLFHIEGSQGTNNIDYGYIYSVKIYQNNELVRDFVPCIRNNDSMVGMYDLVNDVFYYPPNNGTLIAGDPTTPTDCVTTYKGKLTIDDGYEYEWNGSSWVNLGEVTGSTASLPDVPFTVNYNAKNYDASTQTFAKTNGQLADTDVTITGGTLTAHDGYVTVPSNSRGKIISYSTYFNRTNSAPNLTIISKQRTEGSNCHMFANRDTSYNWMYRPYYNRLTLHGTSEQGGVAVTTQPVIESVRIDSNRLATYNNYTDNTSSTQSSFSYGSTNGSVALFAGYTSNTGEWFVGDFYWIYMSQTTLTDAQVQQVIDYNEGAGGQSEYPKYYSEKSDPLNDLTFNTMAEAQTYAYNNCVYDGMRATIDGDRYYFDSTDENGWVKILEYYKVEDVTPNGASGWTISGSDTYNPDSSYYDDFDLETSWTSNSYKIAKVTIYGYDHFTYYLRSYHGYSSSYAYVAATNVDEIQTPPSTMSYNSPSAITNTYNWSKSPKSAVNLSNYRRVTYNNLDKTVEHTFYVYFYGRSYSSYVGNATILIPKKQTNENWEQVTFSSSQNVSGTSKNLYIDNNNSTSGGTQYWYYRWMIGLPSGSHSSYTNFSNYDYCPNVTSSTFTSVAGEQRQVNFAYDGTTSKSLSFRLVDGSGDVLTPSNTVYYNMSLYNSCNVSSSSSNLTFPRSQYVKVGGSFAFSNSSNRHYIYGYQAPALSTRYNTDDYQDTFDIVYTKLSEEAVTITYTTYDPNDSETPAFKTDITYPYNGGTTSSTTLTSYDVPYTYPYEVSQTNNKFSADSQSYTASQAARTINFTLYPNNREFASVADMEAYGYAWEGMEAYVGNTNYKYNNGEWVEYSGTVWLDPSATNALFSIGHYWGENYKMVITTYLSGSYSGDYGSFWEWKQHTPIELSFYSNGFYYDMHNPTSTTAPNVNTGDYSFRIVQLNAFSNYQNSQVMELTLTYGSFKAELADSGTLIYSSGSTKTGYSWYSGLYQANIGFKNANAKCHLSHIQIYNGNDELVNDFKFIKNNGVVGSQEISIYDSVTNTTYNNTNSNTPVYHIET